MPAAPEFILPLLSVLEEHRNEKEAVYMKKYMKGHFEYFGIKAPLRKELTRQFRIENGPIQKENMDKMVRWCWQAPERELQYIAMETLGHLAGKAKISYMSLYEFMILNKSWWDTVDYIAANLIGPYFKLFPQEIKTVCDRWMASGNIWLQRSCLLFQLKYKDKTDVELLNGLIKSLKDSKEFFIRKAIGWVLREYSKTNPDFVLHYIQQNQLSGLSEREALKWLRNKGVIPAI